MSPVGTNQHPGEDDVPPSPPVAGKETQRTRRKAGLSVGIHACGPTNLIAGRGENAACPMNKHSARRSFHMIACWEDRQIGGGGLFLNRVRAPKASRPRAALPAQG